MPNNNYQVKITQQAQEQLQSIVNYISFTIQAQTAALHLLNTIENAINSLEYLPQRIVLTKEEPWCHLGIRKMNIKNFIIYFWIDEPNNLVQVIAIIYNKREQSQQLIRHDIDLFD